MRTSRYYLFIHSVMLAISTLIIVMVEVAMVQAGSAPTPPTVTTSAVTNIMTGSATAGGNVTNQGSAKISVRGVCYATTSTPPPALSQAGSICNQSTTTITGQGTGTFTYEMLSLLANTTYYVRAYATNDDSLTSYGAVVSFTTSQATATPTPTATATQGPPANFIARWCFESSPPDYPSPAYDAANPWTHPGCNTIVTGGTEATVVYCADPPAGGGNTIVTSPRFPVNGVDSPLSYMELTYQWQANFIGTNETITVELSGDNGVSWIAAPDCGQTNAQLTTTPGITQTRTCTISYPPGNYPNARIRFILTGLDAGNDYIALDCMRLTEITAIPGPNCAYEWNFEGIITNGWTIVTGCNGIDPAAPEDNYLECARSADTVTTVQITADVSPADNCLTFEWRGRAITKQNANDDDDFVAHISPNSNCSGGEDLVCNANVSDVANPNTGWTSTTCGIPAAYDHDGNNATPPIPSDIFYLCFDFGTLENSEWLQIDNVSVCEGDCTIVPGPTPAPTAACPAIQTPDDGEVGNPATGWPDLSNHAYPTYLFVASYDWLHNFTDRNTAANRALPQRDPDTDNFNKVIAVDSNLFPIMTSLVGDNEFPNITGRNSLSWAGGGAPSPSVNDYFNRGVAVAPDFITQTNISYNTLTSFCSGGYKIQATTNAFAQYGGRSFMQWAFVTDPGNNNLRRYEFRKLGGFGAVLDGDSDYVNPIVAAPEGHTSNTNCSGPHQPCPPDNTWASGLSDQIVCTINGGQLCDETHEYQPGEMLLTLAKHNFDAFDDMNDLIDYINSDPPDVAPCLEWLQTVPDNVLPYNNLKLVIQGNARNTNNAPLAIGINSRLGDPPGATVPATRFCEHPYDLTSGGAETPDTEEYSFYTNGTCSPLSITNSWDVDPAQSGTQIRIRLCPYQRNNGFILRGIKVGDGDSAFTVNYGGTPTGLESRWSVLTSFLETVPPKSFPGYPEYVADPESNVGYGFTSNTSFTTARNVRFKDPRDVDVYRDMFDSGNYGPMYIFVADSGNSRIQVFMNATGAAGKSNKAFPIRPIPVKGPQDTAATAYKTNELGPRLYLNLTGPAIAVGDGRKADWRNFTTFLGTTLANSTIPADAGRGDFYYPASVAVDQDPNTKDVYLFVADTFNHRVQIFRDTTGVTFQGINSKQFDFKFAAGWGSYPLQTTLTTTQPQRYQFRYPKGLDVARFANNSSYLYVVDSKNYRVLKYLLSEGTAAEGLKDVKLIAGYGYNGTTFATNLTTIMGVPLDAHRDFETGGATALGFLDPQDIATGYSGFYLYSAPRNTAYPYQVTDRNGRPRGVNYLNNYMLYVTDLARNTTTINLRRMNLRVMQFMEHPSYNPATNSARGGFQGVFLPWQTLLPSSTLNTRKLTVSKGQIGRSVFGPAPYGIFNSVPGANGVPAVVPAGQIWGSTNNAGQAGFFTDRPAGVAALTWDTVAPIDFRVYNQANNRVYRNGTTIAYNTALRIGVSVRQMFGLPANNPVSFTNFTARDPDVGRHVDQKYATRVHIFCYNSTGAFQNHTALRKLPDGTDVYTPFALPQGNAFWTSCPAGGYMKIVAEDVHFGYSGKTGSRIFRVQ